MKKTMLAAALCAFALSGLAHAADGAFYVPAHRTKDGSYVPPNVPPSSGSARFAPKLAASRATHHKRRHRHRAGIVVPLFVEAKPVRR
jgi:hypothetical protein